MTRRCSTRSQAGGRGAKFRSQQVPLRVASRSLLGRYGGGAEEAAGEVVQEGEFAGDEVAGGGASAGDGEHHLRDDGEQLGARGGGDFGDLAMQFVRGVEKRDVAGFKRAAVDVALTVVNALGLKRLDHLVEKLVAENRSEGFANRTTEERRDSIPYLFDDL